MKGGEVRKRKRKEDCGREVGGEVTRRGRYKDDMEHRETKNRTTRKRKKQKTKRNENAPKR